MKRTNRYALLDEWTSPPLHPRPDPAALLAYAEVVRAQEEAVENSVRRAREEEDRKHALRARLLALSPKREWYAGVLLSSTALLLVHTALFGFLLFLGICAMVTGAVRAIAADCRR